MPSRISNDSLSRLLWFSPIGHVRRRTLGRAFASLRPSRAIRCIEHADRACRCRGAGQRSSSGSSPRMRSRLTGRRLPGFWTAWLWLGSVPGRTSPLPTRRSRDWPRAWLGSSRSCRAARSPFPRLTALASRGQAANRFRSVATSCLVSPEDMNASSGIWSSRRAASAS